MENQNQLPQRTNQNTENGEIEVLKNQNLNIDFEQDYTVDENQLLTQQAVNVSPVYFEFKKEPDFLICRFVGLTTLTVMDKKTGEIKDLTTALLNTKNGFVFNSGINLVTQLQRLNLTRGTALKIVYSAKKGQTKLYTIYVLR